MGDNASSGQAALHFGDPLPCFVVVPGFFHEFRYIIVELITKGVVRGNKCC